MSKRPPAPTIVFDLDGTLVDTVADIAAAFDCALAPYGCPATRAEEAVAMMGEGLGGFFWRALVAKRLSLPADKAAEAYRRFIAAYRQSPVRKSKIYPGIEGMVVDLRDGGAHTAVCTNKVEDIAIKILEQLEILDLFDAVVGHRDDRPKKPHPLTVFEAISRVGGSPERALMVGDTGADSSAAIAAGIPAILVSYGYSPVQVRALSTDAHIDNVHELRHEILKFIATGDRRIRSRAPPR